MDDFKLKEEGLHADIYESQNTIKKVYDLPKKEAKKNCQLAFKLSQLIPEYAPKVYYNEAPVLIMEKIQGVTLAQYLHNYEKDQFTVYKIVNSMLQAMLAMHGAGYSHLDLHSKNIIIVKDFSVKLIDFDTARKIKRRDEDGELLVDSDYIKMRHHIASLIFLPFKNNIQSVSNTLRLAKKYTARDVIGYTESPEIATRLYDIFDTL